MATGLIIHDNATPSDTLCALLTLRCDRVYCASSGGQGIQMAHEYLPDVIVVDYRLPDMTHEALLTNLRQHSVLCTIPVILYGTAMQRDALKHCMQPNDGFLSFPFRAAELLDQIDRRIRREQAVPAAG